MQLTVTPDPENGDKIKAWEPSNEIVIVNDDGEIIEVINSFHYECD